MKIDEMQYNQDAVCLAQQLKKEKKARRADESARLGPSGGKAACLTASLRPDDQYFMSHFLNLYNNAALLISRNPEGAKEESRDWREAFSCLQ